MFGQPDRGPSHEELAARARRAAWRGRMLAGTAAAFVIALLGAGLWASSAYRAAISDVCETWAPVDISIDELIALKRRKNAWQASMEEDAALVMSDREVDFILPGTTAYELYAEFHGDEITARLAVPLEGGCLNVHFRGKASVHDKVAIFVPAELTVGEFDLAPYVAGRTWAFTSDHVQGWVDPGVLAALDNAEAIWVADSAVHIRLYDRRKVW